MTNTIERGGMPYLSLHVHSNWEIKASQSMSFVEEIKQ
jgi:hypothetical protein